MKRLGTAFSGMVLAGGLLVGAPAWAQVVVMGAGGGSGIDNLGGTTATFPTAGTFVVGNRLVAVVAFADAFATGNLGGAPTLADDTGANAYAIDRDESDGATMRTVVFSGLITNAAIGNLIVTMTGTPPTGVGASFQDFSGTVPSTTLAHYVDNVSSLSANSAALEAVAVAPFTTSIANTLVVAGYGDDGVFNINTTAFSAQPPGAGTFVPTQNWLDFSAPETAMFHEIRTTTASYNSVDPTASGAANYNGVLVAYRGGPDHLSLASGPSTLTAQKNVDCAAAPPAPFVVQLRNVNGLVPAISNFTLRVTSSSTTSKVRIVASGSTPATSCPLDTASNVGTYTALLTSAETSFDVYVTDAKRNATAITLTVDAPTSGFAPNDHPYPLTNAVTSYTVTAGAHAAYCIAFPNQTYTEGPANCLGSQNMGSRGIIAARCLISTTPTSPQTAGTPFNLNGIIAIDKYCNTASVNGSIAFTWAGLNPNTGDSSQPTYATPVSFTNGVGTGTMALTAVTSQSNAFLTFQDSSARVGGSFTAVGAAHRFNVSFPPNTSTAAFSNPNTATATRTGYAAHAPGEVEARITNGTGGSIRSVTITNPGSPWVFTSGTVFNGTTDVSASWVRTVTATSVKFDAGLGVFANGATLKFRANNGGAYPNIGVDTPYTMQVGYTGFQSNTNAIPSAPANQFTVVVPPAVLQLPVAIRSAAAAGSVLIWTNTDLTKHAGVLVTRGGTTAPADLTAYTVGQDLGGGTIAACVVTAAGTQTCTDSALGDATTATYRVYNVDTSNGYSNAVTVDVPARPASGFVYKHTGLGLGNGSADQRVNETSGSTMPGTGAYATFTAANRGIYFVNASGTEKRRPTLLNDFAQRRPLAMKLNDGTTHRVYAGDMTQTAYLLDPTTDSTPATANVGATGGTPQVLGGPAAVTRTQFTGLNASLNNEAIFMATTAATTNNAVRAFRSDLTTGWTKFIGTDGITSEMFTFTNAAGPLGVLLAPVGTAGGGVYGIDLATYTGAGDSQPAGWGAGGGNAKKLAGSVFRAQCRRPGGTASYVFCGTTAGNIVALRISDGVQLASTTVPSGLSILHLVPVTSTTYGLGLAYVTRSPSAGTPAHVGRLTFNGTTTFTSVFDVTVPGVEVLSGALTLETLGQLFVAGNGSIIRMSLLNGTGQVTTALDGSDVSDPFYDNASDTVFIQTDNGSFWARPRSSL
ncbi:MAG: hypothetical protein HY904_07395 [Deltaproteobacteria bacterium]|nr:hypothetical protein [Deltaproteobacteria bacterium]